MNDKKNDLIKFILVIAISLFTAFVGKIVAMYFGFKAIYGILIGLFVPVGIITMSTYDSIRIKDYLGSMGLACVILIVLIWTFNHRYNIYNNGCNKRTSWNANIITKFFGITIKE